MTQVAWNIALRVEKPVTNGIGVTIEREGLAMLPIRHGGTGNENRRHRPSASFGHAYALAVIFRIESNRKIVRRTHAASGIATMNVEN
ncbi:hypothetical protein [Burkholderia thailandensis]|uniref:hypothetical protein n=1 Tax=Burkholderia thailandensis TaxID=57975 RepID=UPI00107EDDCD|nr:hypothetical protein [Burkholderia thailandensis]MCZ2896368.1 hypothetical protein [Burkholderia thailandensis]TGB31179.1 hypothetical protein C6946_24600 [Burkholderia thailandensis]